MLNNKKVLLKRQLLIKINFVSQPSPKSCPLKKKNLYVQRVSLKYKRVEPIDPPQGKNYQPRFQVLQCPNRTLKYVCPCVHVVNQENEAFFSKRGQRAGACHHSMQKHISHWLELEQPLHTQHTQQDYSRFSFSLSHSFSLPITHSLILRIHSSRLTSQSIYPYS